MSGLTVGELSDIVLGKRVTMSGFSPVWYVICVIELLHLYIVLILTS